MSISTSIAIFLVLVGALVLIFGKRVFVLSAGVGTLLAIGFLSLIPGQQDGVLGMLIVFGLALTGGFLGFFVKGLSHLFTAIIGFLAGGAITVNILNVLGFDLGLTGFFLALIGAVIGLVLANRFFKWAIVILAALIGALLVTRGIQLILGGVNETFGTILWIVLAVGGFINLMRGERPTSQPAK
jgi:hypothetical protein